MSDLPENVSIAWDNREPAVTFATVDKQGNPNIIYATCVKKYSESKLVIADNYFSKTRKNIIDGSKGAILFFTKDRKSYQIKGDIEYLSKGEIFNDMKTWLDPKFPGHAATVLNVIEVYQGAEKLL
jgi:predicted pyridoxine 5'-phosphate oxidase superfamily flavin-nucleotide-binding protein